MKVGETPGNGEESPTFREEPQKVCTGRAGTICLFDQGREAPHFFGDLSSPFLKKVGGIYKNGIPEAAKNKALRFREPMF